MWQVHGDKAGPDAPLSPLGELQAHRLGEYLQKNGRSIDAIVASDLRRARQTAEIINAYLHLPITFEPDLREFDAWEAGWAPEPLSFWDTAPLEPASALYLAFRARVLNTVRRFMAGRDEETVLIVAHGGTLGALIRALIGSDTPRIATSNTGLHSLSWLYDAWMIDAINQQEHLPLPLRSGS